MGIPFFGQGIDGVIERFAIDHVWIEALRSPNAHTFMLRMGRVVDGFEIFRIAGTPPISSGGQRPMASSKSGRPSSNVS